MRQLVALKGGKMILECIVVGVAVVVLAFVSACLYVYKAVVFFIENDDPLRRER